MAVEAMTDARIYVNEYDLASVTNSIMVGVDVAEVDVTNFDSAGWTELIAGKKSATVEIGGFLDFAAGKSEDAFNAALGSAGHVVTVTEDDALSSTALFGKAFSGGFTRFGGDVGSAAAMQGTFKTSSADGLIEGQLLLPKATRDAGANGTGVQLGAVGATEKVYAAIHVFGVTGGGSLAAIVQSDDNADFTSATSRVAFTAATTATSEFLSTAGAITDDYWRLTWTLSAGTATFAVVVGIQ